jgi:PhzF family phenazine biosynthesis protein
MEKHPPVVIHTRVFETDGGGGNPAPVVLDATRLSENQMRQIASAFGAETVFVLDPLHQQADVRFRFFVPKHEMEMCVHATIGAVTVLVDRQRFVHSPLRIETLAGTISAAWTRGENGIDIMVEQFAPVFSPTSPSLEDVAGALRILPEAVRLDWGPLQTVSTARPKLIIPLEGTQLLDGLRPDFEALWHVCDIYEITGFYPFTLQTRSQALQAEARQFPKRAGYNEDPATGTAACALSAYLTKHHVLQDTFEGWHTYVIGQGYAMGHPSMLVAEAFVQHGMITKTRVKGNASITDEEALEWMGNNSA